MSIELEPLPYDMSSLAPHISEQTLEFHYGKHHQSYVTKLNGLIDGTADADKTLEELVLSSSGGIFNNAAQVWNHTFYWNCMSPNGGGKPDGELLSKIEAAFGSYEGFVEKFTSNAMNTFGSGWGWLVQKADGSLDIVSTGNAGNPLTDGLTPLLTIDVWEHAYYLDFQNKRPDYIKTFMEELVNWDFVSACLK